MPSRAKKPLIRLAWLLALLTPQAVPACDEERIARIDWEATDSIGRFLSACERAPREYETRLFTWGHSEKLDLLTGYDYGEFYRYNVVQQDAYAGAKARAVIPELTGDDKAVARHNFFEELRSVYGTATVGDLYSYTNQPAHLLAAQNSWRRVSAPGGTRVRPMLMPLDRNGVVDLRKLKRQTTEAQAGFQALALEQLHPGFLTDLAQSIVHLINNIDTALGGGNFSEVHPLRGKLLGLERALNPSSKPSNASFGPAVYFGNTPHGFVSHFYDDNHGGLVCTLDDRDRITDITNPVDGGEDTVRPQDILLQNNVYLRSSAGDAPRKISFPTHYNELSNPPRFRQAARGRLIRYGHIYADNGVIRYRNFCEPIRIIHFDTCAAVRGLLQEDYFTGPQQAQQPLLGYFVREARDAVVRDPDGPVPQEAELEQQVKYEVDQFRRRVSECAGNREEAPTLCGILTSTAFLGSSFYLDNDNKSDLDQAISRCP